MVEIQHERSGGEAGVQVPLLPDPSSRRPAQPDVRIGPLRLQPGPRGTVPRVDAGTEAGHIRGNLPDAHRVEERPGHGVAVRGVQRCPAAGPAAPPARLRELLGQAGEVPDVQVLEAGRGRRRRSPPRGSATGTARSGWPRRTRHWRSCGPGRCPTARNRRRSPSAGTRPGGGASRSWSSAPSRRCPRQRQRWGSMRGSRPWSPCQPGRRSPTPSTSGGIGPGSRSAQRALSRKAEGLREPRQGPPEGGPGARPDHRPAPRSCSTNCPRGSSAKTKR